MSSAAMHCDSPPDFQTRFPLGASISVAELERDPYPFFAQVREREPLTWVEALKMWYLTGYDDVRRVLMDGVNFSAAAERSPIRDTFGEQMLSSEGETHRRYRRVFLQGFSAVSVSRLESQIRTAATGLADECSGASAIELRTRFASRLPIHTILLAFGMDLTAEQDLRRWYDDFERALANFEGDPHTRERAQRSAKEFHEYLHPGLQAARRNPDDSLLSSLVNAPADRRLNDEELVRNLSIVFFGGISTVEALILNSLWALSAHPELIERVRSDETLLANAIEETMRWLGPVQSATRYVTHDVELRGVMLRAGETVNCMLGAANHDPLMFPHPERFDITRRNLTAHMGFATGHHMCLGFRLAKAQVRIALQILLSRFVPFEVIDREANPPTGYEFRQPRAMWIRGAVR
jgi:cytochrome P450